MLSKFKELIGSSKKIAIFSHVKPDADALCSSFALKNIIKNNYDYKFVDVFIDGEIGELYNPILRDEVINPDPYEQYDLAIVLDCPNASRIGDYQDLLKNIPTVINIDHHETNEKFGTLNYASSKLSSTCELVYVISKAQGYDFNNLIAKQLYQGIITDTNCFTSSSVSKITHMVVSELMNYKFDFDAIKQYYFSNNSPAKTNLLSRALQSMKYYNGEKFTVMKIPYETMQKLNATYEDTLGIIDNGINVSGTEVSAILIETEPNLIHCSLRSKGIINVGEIAKKYGGGGSEKLAAFQANGEIKEIMKNLVEVVSPMLPEEDEKDDILF